MKQSCPVLWCLHGTLQTSEVWDPLRRDLSIAPPSATGVPCLLKAHDLWRYALSSLESWAASFCEEVELDASGAPQLLCGYSLGGRLALHALLRKPSLWSGAIIIGAHPGVDEGDERAARLERDKLWLERFLAQPIEDVLRDWNAQLVFGGKKNAFYPRELPREFIVASFDAFSLGRQRPLTGRLSDLKIPILYLTGDEDPSYGAIGESLAGSIPNVSHRRISGGHRAPFESPEELAREVRQFVSLFFPAGAV